VIRAIRQTRLPAAAAAIAAVALAAPSIASAASLQVDPVRKCYRSGQTVFLNAQGYTPNGFVDFTRDGNLIERVQADASGAISATLRLRTLLSGRRRLTYVGTDVADPSINASVTLLTSSTFAKVRPLDGVAHLPKRIAARGFFGGSTLWAHVVRLRRGARPSLQRTLKIGRIRGACRRVSARRSLFRRDVAPGRYQLQFDTFRRYRANRDVEYDRLVYTIFR
jgi:hypothetical protein